nr:uncharacterized protein LOC129274779 [Lytechinus pictus]
MDAVNMPTLGTVRHTNKQNPGRIFLCDFIIAVILAFDLFSNCKAQCSDYGKIVEFSRPHQINWTNNPDSYFGDSPCSWNVTIPGVGSTWRIQVKVLHIDLLCCNCEKEYLLIKDGSESSARPIVVLCGGPEVENPNTLTSSGPALYAEFQIEADDITTGSKGLGYALEFQYFDSAVSCPVGWASRNEFCYKLYHEALPWQQAASRCGYDGGFLTSIFDRDENDFLVETFGSETSLAWIGIDSDESNHWLDGSSSLHYTNFRSKSSEEPDSGCYILELGASGSWSISDCQLQQKFICKKSQDGSGGRYWTEVIYGPQTNPSKRGLKPGIAWVLTVVFFLLGVCFKGKRENMVFTITMECLKSFFECCVERVVECFTPCTLCFRRIRRRRRFQARTTRTVPSHHRRQHHEAMDNPPTSQIITSRSTPVETDDHITQRERMTPPSPSPSSDDEDATSEPAAPPSYSNALAPRFDISFIDHRTSPTTSMNDAVPTYEYAMARTETNV